ncbi:hypothetical protein A3860_30655 [Niastella vici]|uniref:DUF255 domain-containing protein n=1 Tax=Niastella vici TaxID=1703345 RepID=A0A1V9FTX7_9BACT|nr:hypothetical protein [Niastella vici]OQP61829.1 hypothetical protein A3860_30655 [Niastella vici]
MTRLLLLTLLLPAFTRAQFLAPETTLQQALVQATREDKLIFLMIESDQCQQCNDVAGKALQKNDLKDELKRNFIALRIPAFHPDRNYIKDKYNYIGGNVVLYLDKWGTLVHRMNMSTTAATIYLYESKRAYLNEIQADYIRSLEQDALAGKMESDKLYELMEARKTLSLPIDEHLDQYVKQLPADSLTSISTLQRIARMSPLLGSNANSILRNNQELFNQAWYALPEKDRITINNQIIIKSRHQAISEKNVAKAEVVAKFAALTYSGAIFSGKPPVNKAYHYNLMEYFRGANDTAAYLNAAVNYYELYQMPVNATAIKKKDSLKMAELKKDPVRNISIRDTLEWTETRKVFTTTTRYTPTAQHYGEELHYAARTFYRMTNDTIYLKKALQWAAYANEFYESAYALDIWARLLYKVGNNKEEAVHLEERAIDFLKKHDMPTETHMAVLDKMKKGISAID